MSARVCNPVALSERAMLLRSPAVIRRPTASSTSSIISLAKVKKNLFGAVDKQESKNFIDRQLAAQSDALCKKWGFDFAAGTPLQNHDQYKWERVPPMSAPALFTEMVTLTRSAHLVAQSSTSAENLLDQRAERENGSLNRHHHQSTMIGSSASVSGSDSDSDCSFETIRTHPFMLRSETVTTTASITISAVTAAASATSSSSASINRAKRQQRITDYLKERKRLSTGTPKSPAAKKARQMLMPSASSASSSSMPSNATVAQQQQQDH